ncbi:solute carrier family 15 member 2-like [Oscarella lobularis]|uniref:solute carrier family 15 member 2-like n=1 Tax=Oscarella lobularis TaxID=121494 RepID=UPI003313E3FD
MEGGDSAKYPWKAMAFLMTTTATLNYASSGLQAVLELYFSKFLFNFTLGGTLGKQKINRLSTTCFNVIVALQQISALVAGFLADLLLGNYKTQVLSCLFSTLGGAVLLFTTWQILPSGVSHYDLSIAVKANGSNTTSTHLHLDLGLASLALLLLNIGIGLSTVQSVFVGDQFTEEQEKEKARGFGWYYLFQNIGSLFSESGAPILRQTFGFFICFASIVGTVVASTLSFLSGSFCYRKVPPVYGCNCKKRIPNAEETANLLTEGQSVQQHRPPTFGKRLLAKVKELKGIIAVFSPLIVYWALFFQQNSVWVLQGQRMNCYFGDLHVPPDLMPSFNDVLVVIFIPLMEYVVYPHIEKTMNVKIRPLHKIFAGMTAAAISFILAGLLELYIEVPVVDCRGNVNLAWQVPQYIAISFAEVLVSVTVLEFAYSQAPNNSKNFATALGFLSQALGTAAMAGLAEIPLARKAEFFVYSGLMALVIAVSFFLNRNFRYRND